MSVHRYMKVEENIAFPDMENTSGGHGLPSTDSSQQLMTDSVSLDSNGSRRRTSRQFAGFGGITATEWFTVLVLCFVNLINYMDRFTIAVNYNLLRGTNAVCKSGDRTSKLSQLRLSIFLFFLLGLTWIFGLLSTAFSETSIVFSYLFCLTSTLQGFVMFLYFVILDPVARNLWIYFFRRLCCSKKGMIDIRKDNSSKDSKDSY